MTVINRISYLRIRFDLASPLSIGSGIGNHTDKDVMVDGAGYPFVPGSTLAGIYLSYFEENDETKKWFGTLKKATASDSSSSAVESRIRVYDATCNEYGKNVIVNRDSVRLDEYKTAVTGAKFDFEVVQPGVTFVTYVEVQQEDDDPGFLNAVVQQEDDDPGFLNAVASLWKNEKFSFGSKTGKGLGRVTNIQLDTAEFNMNDPAQVDRWIGFDLYGDGCWKKWDEASVNKVVKTVDKKICTLKLGLKLKGGISVRRYMTDLPVEDKSSPDFSQMVLDDGTPVVPGTSWAGVFRHDMSGMISNEMIEQYFGKHDGEEKLRHRSRIGFSETYLKNSKPKVMTRTAIDRVTGGAQDGALYTEKTYYGGEGELTITYPESSEEGFRKALAAAAADLNAGFISAGGLGSVGRGLFSITSVNGEDFTKYADDMERSKAIYEYIVEVSA